MSWKTSHCTDQNQYRIVKREQKRRYREKTGSGMYQPRSWTTYEMNLVIRHVMSDRLLAIKLHRSVGSIQQKRTRLKNSRNVGWTGN